MTLLVQFTTEVDTECWQPFCSTPPPPGPLRLLYTYVNQKKKNMWKEVFFAVERVKQEMRLGVLNAIFQEKEVGFCQILLKFFRLKSS